MFLRFELNSPKIISFPTRWIVHELWCNTYTTNKFKNIFIEIHKIHLWYQGVTSAVIGSPFSSTTTSSFAAILLLLPTWKSLEKPHSDLSPMLVTALRPLDRCGPLEGANENACCRADHRDFSGACLLAFKYLGRINISMFLEVEGKNEM
jgi:hypothetical protein